MWSEEYYLLGNDAVYSVESQPTFRRNISPPSSGSKKLQAACHLRSRWFLAWLILRPWRWRRYVPPKRRLAFNWVHCIISQNIVLFMTTGVKTSNPAFMWSVRHCFPILSDAELCRQILVKLSGIKFHENLFWGSWVYAKGQTKMTKLIGALSQLSFRMRRRKWIRVQQLVRQYGLDPTLKLQLDSAGAIFAFILKMDTMIHGEQQSGTHKASQMQYNV
jgi:hypothetical protein